MKEMIGEGDLVDPEIRGPVETWLKRKHLSEGLTARTLSRSIAPFHRIEDKALFTQILKAKRYSLLCGMLLINGDETHHLNDGATSRRFFVEYDDSGFGIMKSTQDMSTGDLVAISKKFGVRRAIYMDTGMYDMATYRDGSGADHVIGHTDTAESTNRVVIYEAE